MLLNDLRQRLVSQYLTRRAIPARVHRERAATERFLHRYAGEEFGLFVGRTGCCEVYAIAGNLPNFLLLSCVSKTVDAWLEQVILDRRSDRARRCSEAHNSSRKIRDDC